MCNLYSLTKGQAAIIALGRGAEGRMSGPGRYRHVLFAGGALFQSAASLLHIAQQLLRALHSALAALLHSYFRHCSLLVLATPTTKTMLSTPPCSHPAPLSTLSALESLCGRRPGK